MERLDPAAMKVPGLEVRVARRCTSTNALLLAEAPAHPVLLAAERQSAGRGRRGRRWHSAPGAGATFSIAWRMRCAPRALSGLSLAVGAAAARALRALGARGVAVKWPNDLMARRRKLGGILIETRADGAGTRVVVGIGINCRAQPRLGNRLGRGIAALDELTPRPQPRNLVVSSVAGAVVAILAAWDQVEGRKAERKAA